MAPSPFPMSDTPSTTVVDRLLARLTSAHIDFQLTSHAEVRTSAEAAAARGTPLHSGAKALIVKAATGFVMLVIPADMSLRSSAARKLVHSKRMRFATPEELMGLTGLKPGSVPPFGSLFDIQTICDERLADNERINFNCGSRSRSIQMSYHDYVVVEDPQIASIARCPES